MDMELWLWLVFPRYSYDSMLLNNCRQGPHLKEFALNMNFKQAHNDAGILRHFLFAPVAILELMILSYFIWKLAKMIKQTESVRQLQFLELNCHVGDALFSVIVLLLTFLTEIGVGESTTRFFQMSTLVCPWTQATSAAITNAIIFTAIYGGTETYWAALARRMAGKVMITSWALFILLDVGLFVAGLMWPEADSSARSVAGWVVAIIYLLLYVATVGSTIAGVIVVLRARLGSPLSLRLLTLEQMRILVRHQVRNAIVFSIFHVLPTVIAITYLVHSVDAERCSLLVHYRLVNAAFMAMQLLIAVRIAVDGAFDSGLCRHRDKDERGFWWEVLEYGSHDISAGGK